MAKTSNLLYPITVLEAERDNIPCLPGSQVAQLNKAIDILNDERIDEEMREGIKRQEEEKLKEKVKEIRKGILDE